MSLRRVLTGSDGSGTFYPTRAPFSTLFVNRFSRDANKAGSSASSVSPANAGSRQGQLGSSAPTSSAEEARQLLEEVQQLGSRMRNNRRRAQQIDRRAAAFASRLARHAARLLQHMPNAVPAVRPVPGTGASTLRHYILKHDQLEAPDRTRLLVVSSDGRLRICTVLTYGQGSRLWDDYEVANPPAGLGLSVVFEGLSSLIVKLETAVVDREQQSSDQEKALDGLIAQSEAKLANAGSRLAPAGDAEDDLDDDTELFGPNPGGELRSYGFEQRISFGKTEAAEPTGGSEKPAATTPARGRFQR